MFFCHFRHEVLAQVMDKGLDGYKQVAVCRGHHDGQDSGQGQACKPGWKDADCKRGHHCIGTAVLCHHIGQDLLCNQAHEEYQGNGHHVDGGAPEHALGC